MDKKGQKHSAKSALLSVDGGAEEATIAAVVVTYNRKNLLRECLQALASQTRALDEIIVINNASTDDTEQMILKEFPQVTYVRLPENVGGAGGFHEGMKLAYDKGHNWIWVMDDDAIAHQEAVENLASCITDSSAAYLSLAIDIKDMKTLCWPIKVRRGRFLKKLDDMPDKAVLEVPVAPFVGLLVNREVISRVGLPRSEFFIMCDDVEYSLRMQSAGFNIKVCVTSYVYHPRSPMIVSIGKFRVEKSSMSKYYYSLRNCLYVKWLYYSTLRFWMLSFPESLVKSMLYIICNGLKNFPHRVGVIFSAYRDAWRQQLGKRF